MALQMRLLPMYRAPSPVSPVSTGKEPCCDSAVSLAILLFVRSWIIFIQMIYLFHKLHVYIPGRWMNCSFFMRLISLSVVATSYLYYEQSRKVM